MAIKTVTLNVRLYNEDGAGIDCISQIDVQMPDVLELQPELPKLIQRGSAFYVQHIPTGVDCYRRVQCYLIATGKMTKLPAHVPSEGTFD
jgi:hypothetical protein